MIEIQIENSIQCPHCNGYAKRIRRGKIDRWMSLIRPVVRFKCQNNHCQRVGNIYQNRPANKKTLARK